MKTTSYEISKKLAEIGFRAKTPFAWFSSEYCAANGPECNLEGYIWDGKENVYGAYDLEIIIEALRKVKWFRCQIDKPDAKFGYCEIYRDKKNELQELTFSMNNLNGESLVDTGAKFLLKLHEKGIIKFDEVKP